MLIIFISMTIFNLLSINTDTNVSIFSINKIMYANAEYEPTEGCDTERDNFFESGDCENNDPCNYWMAAGTLYTCVNNGESSTCEDGWSYFNDYCNCDRYNYNDVVQAICR